MGKSWKELGFSERVGEEFETLIIIDTNHDLGFPARVELGKSWKELVSTRIPKNPLTRIPQGFYKILQGSLLHFVESLLEIVEFLLDPCGILVGRFGQKAQS